MGWFSGSAAAEKSGGLANSVAKIADGFSRLVTQHIALARIEIQNDARAVGSDLGRLLAFVPFVLVGYALLCGALGVLLGRWLGTPGGLTLVGIGNVIGGGVGIHWALGRLKGRHVMGETLQEFNRSTAVLDAIEPAGTEGPHAEQR